MNSDVDSTKTKPDGVGVTGMNENYRASHEGKGDSYHARFLENPKRALMWSIEQRVLKNITGSFLAGKDIDYLDFACGTGRVLALMEKETQNATGVDVSKSMLEVARKNVTRAEVIEGDITRNAVLPGREFDLITAFRFFPNAEDQLREDAMNALAKRLKPGGFLVFNNHKSASALSYRVVKMLRRNSADQPTAKTEVRPGAADRRMTKAEVQRLVESAGLHIRKAYPIGILPDYETRLLRPRFLVSMIEKVASRLPISSFAENIIYVCSKDSH